MRHLVYTLLTISLILGLIKALAIFSDMGCVNKSITFLPTEKIEINGRLLVVKEARTSCEQAQGLMHVRSLDHDGMLFTFPEPEEKSFWMKNTLISLSIAYISEEGVIIKIMDMPSERDPANPTQSYKSDVPVKYALEVPMGKFKDLGIKVGQKMERK